MKKLQKIVIPLLCAVILVVAVWAVWRFFGQSQEKNGIERKAITIYDAQGNTLISTDTATDIYDVEYWPYLEIVLSETAQIIAQKEDCSPQETQMQLFSRGYQIHTSFDKTAFEALKNAENRWSNTCNTAGVITDLEGNLLAVYCTDTADKQANYALERRSPYSSFKALSVYTPAVEKGIVNWASLYRDKPYKQIKGDDGKLQDWPANATGVYSKEALTVYEALRKSLNTVAVHCLADIGIQNSMDFLRDSFGIPLKEEFFVVDEYGEEEVIGNIALGYLETGITPMEMAGYYQIFANGGEYTPPEAVAKITLEDGAVYYSRKAAPKQVISPATADIMNKLLQGVVAPGGTGEMAKCKDVEIAGKTGTGDSYADNWFVGVTPGYSLALWHGQHDSNQAEEMFAAVVENLYGNLPNANRKFITHQNLYQIAYCAKSGKALSSNCTLIDMGYFASQNALPVCDACSKS